MKKRQKLKKERIKKLRPLTGAVIAAGLPMETDGATVKVTMLGQGLVLVENHRGVYSCAEDGITLTGSDGMIGICGRGLVIRELNREQMLIVGCITGVSYE